MMKCTYKDCGRDHAEPWGEGKGIALCQGHRQAVESSQKAWLEGGGMEAMKRFLGHWARAHGTAQRFADRIQGR